MRAYLECDAAVCCHCVAAFDFFPVQRSLGSGCPLFVNCGLPHAQLAAAEHDDQIACGIQAHFFGACCSGAAARDRETQAIRVHARRDAQIVFHTFGVAVGDDVHSGQDVLRFRCRKMLHVCAPLRGIIAKEIIALAADSVRALPRETFCAG